MHSFFVNNIEENYFKIENQDFHHLKNVLKLKENEQIICVFENKKYLCFISTINQNNAYVKIIEPILMKQKNYQVNLILALVREQKWNYILQKATEFNVDKIIPVEFKRNVVKIDSKNIFNKLERWNKICQNSSQQSRRCITPQIYPIVKNIIELENIKADLKLVCWEKEKTNFIKNEFKKNFKTINIVVGPEGGLEKSEVEKLNQMGYINVSLGNNILRSESVPLFLLSCLNYEKED